MTPSRPPAFAALRHSGYRRFFIASTFATTGDSIEHVVSYWILFQVFKSPMLGGVAVLTHWIPFLLFSVYAGSVADRYDLRRVIQVSQGLMMLVSLGWAVTFMTNTLNEATAVVLLCMHGMFGVLTVPAQQLIVHEMVGPAELHSAVRMNSSSRQLGLLLGAAIGGAMMLVLSPAMTLLINLLFYTPIVIWAARTKYGARLSGQRSSGSRSGGLADALDTLRKVAGDRVILAMILLAGGASLFIGNAYQPQMPEFAHDLSEHHDHAAGLFYSLLLSADAAGAVSAAIILESRGLLNAHPRTAIILTILWCLSLAGFALTSSYPVALALMFAAGFFSLTFYAMAQTLVQLRAPAELRGRVVGLFAAASLGLRAFSGVTIGVLGGLIGIHWSLAASAMALLATALILLTLSTRRAPA